MIINKKTLVPVSILVVVGFILLGVGTFYSRSFPSFPKDNALSNPKQADSYNFPIDQEALKEFTEVYKSTTELPGDISLHELYLEKKLHPQDSQITQSIHYLETHGCQSLFNYGKQKICLGHMSGNKGESMVIKKITDEVEQKQVSIAYRSEVKPDTFYWLTLKDNWLYMLEVSSQFIRLDPMGGESEAGPATVGPQALVGYKINLDTLEYTKHNLRLGGVSLP